MCSDYISHATSDLLLFLRRGWRWLLVAGLIILGLQLLVRIAPAQSAGDTYTVILGDISDGTCAPDDSPDEGTCTLREAFIAANQTNTAATIILPAGVYELSLSGGGEDNARAGDLDIAGELTIKGSGAGSTVIDGHLMSDRVLDVLMTGELTISDVTIRGGNSNPEGGGIHNEGVLTVRDVVLDGNSANNGGAILSDGDLLVENTTFVNNSANSGGALPSRSTPICYAA